MSPPEVSFVQQRIINLYVLTRSNLSSKTKTELEELRNRSESIRHTKSKPWSERAAAEIVYAACTMELGD